MNNQNYNLRTYTDIIDEANKKVDENCGKIIKGKRHGKKKKSKSKKK
jgi:hypothetical protein